MKKLTTYSLVLFFLFFTSQSHAWIRSACGNGGVVQPWPVGIGPNYRLLTNTAPTGVDLVADFNRTIDGYNRISDSSLVITGAGNGADINVNINDGISEIGFVDFDTFINPGTSVPVSINFPNAIALQYTRTEPGTCIIDESDIVLDSERNWISGRLAQHRYSPQFYVGLTLSHEIGHGLGLAHSNGFLAKMNANYPFGGPLGQSNDEFPYIDEIRAVRYLYPATGGIFGELISSRYKNFYGPNAIFNEVKNVSNNAQTITLTRGQAYFIDYTVENQGRGAVNNVNVEFLLSTNTTINSYFDTSIGSLSLNMPYGSTTSSTAWVQIPNSIPTGDYFIGVTINEFGTTIGEVDLGNNKVVIPSPRIDGSFIVD